MWHVNGPVPCKQKNVSCNRNWHDINIRRTINHTGEGTFAQHSIGISDSFAASVPPLETHCSYYTKEEKNCNSPAMCWFKFEKVSTSLARKQHSDSGPFTTPNVKIVVRS